MPTRVVIGWSCIRVEGRLEDGRGPTYEINNTHSAEIDGVQLTKSTTPHSAEIDGSVNPESLHGMNIVERDMLYVGSQVGSHAMLVLAAKSESPAIMESFDHRIRYFVLIVAEDVV
jgi:hypothetical protein